MRASRPLGILAGIAAIALATLTVASPAAAATLPSGQRITVIGQYYQIEVGGEGQFYDASAANAASTAYGPTNPWPFMSGVDVKDDGIGYAVGLGEADAPSIFKVDANTGVVGDPVAITFAVGDDVIAGCHGIDVQPDDTVIIGCFGPLGDDSLPLWIGTIDPESGELTPEYTEEFAAVQIEAIALDPTTGLLWVFSSDQVSWFEDVLELETWTIVDGSGLGGGPVYGADFDRNGQLFVTTERPFDEDPEIQLSWLATLDTDAALVSDVGMFIEGGTALPPTAPITVWGKEALPATGPAEIVPLGIGGALLFLAGAAFIATRRIQRGQEA